MASLPVRIRDRSCLSRASSSAHIQALGSLVRLRLLKSQLPGVLGLPVFPNGCSAWSGGRGFRATSSRPLCGVRDGARANCGVGSPGLRPRRPELGGPGRMTLLWVSAHLLSLRGPRPPPCVPLSATAPPSTRHRNGPGSHPRLPPPTSKASPLNTLRGSQMTHPFSQSCTLARLCLSPVGPQQRSPQLAPYSQAVLPHPWSRLCSQNDQNVNRMSPSPLRTFSGFPRLLRRRKPFKQPTRLPAGHRLNTGGFAHPVAWRAAEGLQAWGPVLSDRSAGGRGQRGVQKQFVE